MKATLIGGAVRCALGQSIDELCNALRSGACGAVRNPLFDASTFPSPFACAIPRDPFPSPHARFLRRAGQFAREAAIEAWVGVNAPVPPHRRGLYFGYGGLRANWNAMHDSLIGVSDNGPIWKKGLARLHPYWMLTHLSNNAHAVIAKDLECYGDGATYGGSNAGAEAMAAAIEALHAEVIDIAIVCAADSMIEPEVVMDLGLRGRLSNEMQAAPYRDRANGTVVGEAAAALVLTRTSDAHDNIDLEVVEFGTEALSLPDIADVFIRFPSDWARSDALFMVDGAGIGIPAYDTAELAHWKSLLEDRFSFTSCQAALGEIGAVHAPMQALVLAEALRGNDARASVAIGLSVCEPGAGAFVRIQRRTS